MKLAFGFCFSCFFSALERWRESGGGARTRCWEHGLGQIANRCLRHAAAGFDFGCEQVEVIGEDFHVGRYSYGIWRVGGWGGEDGRHAQRGEEEDV